LKKKLLLPLLRLNSPLSLSSPPSPDDVANAHTTELNSAWVSPKDIYPLPEKDIRAFLSKGGKSNGELRRGYEVALDPTAWIAQKAEEDTQRAMQYEENLARIEAGEAEEEYDYELESVAKKAGGGKRKRASEASPKMRVNAQDSRNKKASNVR
jgi:hypothetical protein